MFHFTLPETIYSLQVRLETCQKYILPHEEVMFYFRPKQCQGGPLTFFTSTAVEPSRTGTGEVGRMVAAEAAMLTGTHISVTPVDFCRNRDRITAVWILVVMGLVVYSIHHRAGALAFPYSLASVNTAQHFILSKVYSLLSVLERQYTNRQ